MSRQVTSEFLSEIRSEQLTPVLLIELQFSGGTVNFWTGLGTLTWDGKTWQGTGNFGKLSTIEETSRTVASGVEFTLTGIPSSIISTAFNQFYQGRPAKYWFGVLNEKSKLIIDPVLIFSGKMDIMIMRETGETGTISLTVENDLIDLERPRTFRYTSEDHKSYFTDDTFFDQVQALQDVQIRWGRQ